MEERLFILESNALRELSGASNKDTTIQIKVKYLGRRGELATATRELSNLPMDERRESGKCINKVKKSIEQMVGSRLNLFASQERERKLRNERIDVTLPGRRGFLGKKHPITLILNQVKSFFISLGFDVAVGPEIETDYYNFEALNIPRDHPARDMQDTFYLDDHLLLRTHTSPVQIRYMKERIPPLRAIAPGKVYRRDADLSHTPMFHQVEGFMVDSSVTFGDLKGVLNAFLRYMFCSTIETRFRPSFFPFTEPSAEVDIRCLICSGEGCRVCKGTGWLEVLGAGMIHPKVFASVGYDPKKYTGFAFGIGIERIAMLKLGVEDIRLFFDNDTRFIMQF